jgi:hypothetical protein
MRHHLRLHALSDNLEVGICSGKAGREHTQALFVRLLSFGTGFNV